eukprot:34084_1
MSQFFDRFFKYWGKKIWNGIKIAAKWVWTCDASPIGAIKAAYYLYKYIRANDTHYRDKCLYSLGKFLDWFCTTACNVGGVVVGSILGGPMAGGILGGAAGGLVGGALGTTFEALCAHFIEDQELKDEMQHFTLKDYSKNIITNIIIGALSGLIGGLWGKFCGSDKICRPATLFKFFKKETLHLLHGSHCVMRGNLAKPLLSFSKYVITSLIYVICQMGGQIVVLLGVKECIAWIIRKLSSCVMCYLN